MSALTSEECRAAVVRFVAERGGRVPSADVARMCASLGLGPQQGRADLRVLVKGGRLEQRRSETARTHRGRYGGTTDCPAVEYRTA